MRHLEKNALFAVSVLLANGCGGDLANFGNGSGDADPVTDASVELDAELDAGADASTQSEDALEQPEVTPEAGDEGRPTDGGDGGGGGGGGDGGMDASDALTDRSDAEAGDVHVEQTETGSPGPLVFSIILRQTVQQCDRCGLFFDWQDEQADKPKFEVEFEHDGSAWIETYQHGLDGMENAFGFFVSPNGESAKHTILVKQWPQRTGLFRADISDIPFDATITKATLYLHINTEEGLFETDDTSVLSVHACEKPWSWDHATWSNYDHGLAWEEPGGDFGDFIREIRAKEDIRDRGYSSENPDVGFDFTAYVAQLQAAR